MIKTLFSMMLALAAALIPIGCTPTADNTPEQTESKIDVSSVETFSKAAAYATAYACKLSSKFTPEVQENVVKIVTIVSAVIPGPNETFESTWIPLAKTELDKLVADKKIDPTISEIVLEMLSKVIKNLDGYVLTKHPEWKTNSNILATIVKSFSEAYVKVLTPNTALAATDFESIMDKEAFENVK